MSSHITFDKTSSPVPAHDATTQPATVTQDEHARLVGELPDGALANAFPEWDLLPPLSMPRRQSKTV